MSNCLAILLFLFLHFSHVLPMQQPNASGSAYNAVRVKKVVSSPAPSASKEHDIAKLRLSRHSSHSFVFQAEDQKEGAKDLIVDAHFQDLGFHEEVKEQDGILGFDRFFHCWEDLLPERQKELFYMLPAYQEYRGLYGSYFYGNKKKLKPDYENACVKIQKLMDDFNKGQLPMKLEKIKSFSLASYCLSSFMVINGQYPVRLFDRNLFGNEYKCKRDLFLGDPFNEKAYLDVVTLQEEVSNLAIQEKLQNDELLKKE